MKYFLIKIYSSLFGIKRKGDKVRTIIGKDVKITNTIIQADGKDNVIEIDSYSRIRNCKFVFIGKGEKNRVTIGNGCKLTNVTFYLEGQENEIVIGNKTSCSGNTEFAALSGTKIIVGDDCMFAQNISIRTSDSHPIYNEQKQIINYPENVYIGNHVWVGTHVYVLKGVRLNDDIVIGACSLVSKSFDTKNVIIAGNPAKIIKENCNWCREWNEDKIY